MNLDDQQLDELLKGVAVPPDLRLHLRARLDELPALSSAVDSATQTSTQTTLLNSLPAENSGFDSAIGERRPFAAGSHPILPWAIAIAVLLLILVGGVIAWKLDLGESRPDNSLLVESKPAERTKPAEPSAKRLIAEFDRQMNMQKLVLMELETQNLHKKIELVEEELSHLRSKASWNDPSMTLAFVAESSLKAGNSPLIVKEDLQLVIDRFPDSVGALRAKELLAKMN